MAFIQVLFLGNEEVNGCSFCLPLRFSSSLSFDSICVFVCRLFLGYITLHALGLLVAMMVSDDGFGNFRFEVFLFQERLLFLV